jgi:hypothetical protein
MRHKDRASKALYLGGALLIAASMVFSACDRLLGSQVPTPIPSQYLPTAIALTLQAAQASPTPGPASNNQGTPEAMSIPTEAQSPTSSATPQPSATPTETPGPSPTPYTLPPPPTETPLPEIPNAPIEIRNLGAYSRVTSPLHLYAYLKPGAGGKVNIELLGEDGRLLVREIKVMDLVPVGAWAVLSMDLDFEIEATAEAGRLLISVADEYGRIVALNSVPLILLSVGEADITPPIDVLTPILIQEPTKRTLIQGGKVLVSGLARPSSNQPLVVKLITADQAEVGMRLAPVDAPPDGSYTHFAVEVPYQVADPTQVLLAVSEGGNSLDDPARLVSLEVMLSP